MDNNTRQQRKLQLNVAIYNYITEIMNETRYETGLPIFDEMDKEVIEDLVEFITTKQ